MNHRDQHEGRGRHAGGRGGQHHGGREPREPGRYQEFGRHGGPERQSEDRGWEEREWRQPRAQSGGSEGQRYGQTFNPETQWFDEDRGRASHGDYREYDESTGRGSYASSGRPWGDREPAARQGGYRGDRGGAGRAQRDFLSQDYGSGGYDLQSYGSQGMDLPNNRSQGGYGYQSYGGFGRGRQQEYAGASGGYGGPDYGSPNYQRQFGGRGVQSGYGERGYASGQEYGAGDYGSRSGYHFAGEQSDTGYNRSFRGLGPQSYKRPDERIRDDLYERLTDNHRIDARNIAIEVSQGSVTLSGTVPERRMRYAAEDLAESCMGVTDISNQLKVREHDSDDSGATSGASDSTKGAGSGGSKRH